MASLPGRKIIVDNSADDKPPQNYEAWLASGISVVTPNKKFGSGPLMRYEKAMRALTLAGSRFLGEATVGAGLPVMSTLQELRETSDNIKTIEGIFSGTLSYLFNTATADMPFSSVVQK